MFDPYHDAFFYFNNLFGIKYSCIGLILFFVILKYFYWRCENEYSDGGMQLHWKKLTNRECQSVIGVGVTYILLLVSNIPFWRFLHGFDFLQEPAKLFLSMEPLISLVMVALAIGALWICGSQREYLNVLNVTVRILIFVSVASSLLVNQFDPWSWYNIVWLLFVGGLLLWLKLLSLNKLATKTSSNMFDAVAAYDELFPLRKTQADELCRIMSNPDSRGISICVTGPWGIGKTSLIIFTNIWFYNSSSKNSILNLTNRCHFYNGFIWFFRYCLHLTTVPFPEIPSHYSHSGTWSRKIRSLRECCSIPSHSSYRLSESAYHW